MSILHRRYENAALSALEVFAFCGIWPRQHALILSSGSDMRQSAASGLVSA
jgi:hypothetical protein